MADVTPSVHGARDRGQMLLIAAFGVAVMLVALALILNTAIYTENIATRGSDISGGKDAARYRAATQDSVGGTIEYANYHNNSSYTELETAVRWGVWNYSNMSGRQQAMDSIATRTSLKRQSRGVRVYQHSDENLSGENDRRNWTVVEGTTGVRALSLNLSTGLAEDNPGDVTLSQSPAKFYVNFTDSSNPGTQWVRVYIFNDSTTTPEQATVRVFSQSGGFEGQCTAQYGGDSRIEIDITSAEMDGTDCEPLHAVHTVYDDEFDVLYNNTQDGGGSYTAVGQYSLVANLSGSAYGSLSTVDASDPLPDRTRAIYSVTVHTVYESHRLYLETDVRVAPGEPDG